MKSLKPMPLVNVATACEKVLIEKDNVVSAIRIVDVFNVVPPPIPLPAEVGLQMTALIVLRAGDFRGEAEISIAIVTPDGQRQNVPEKWPMLFQEENTGGNLVFNFAMAVRHIGLSWVEVMCDGVLLTKFPIMLQQAPKPSGQLN
jgi:hypothetical protein